MNLVIMVVALLSVLITGPAQQVEDTQERGEAIVQEKPDTVRDANVAEGWYRHEGTGWTLWPKEDFDMNHPPYGAYAEFLSREEVQGVIGVLSLSFPFAVIWHIRRGRRKRVSETSGEMDPVQFQAVMRKLQQFTEVLDRVSGKEEMVHDKRRRV